MDKYGANIINLSISCFDAYQDGSDEQCQVVDYAFNQGALVFVSAGNEAGNNLHYSGTVAAYGTTDYIKINVGETDEASLSFYVNWFD